MASSIASSFDISADTELRWTRNRTIKPVNTKEDEDNAPYKWQTSVYKTGGIFCHICLEIYKRKKDYEAHYVRHKTHETEMVYTCVLCKKQFPEYPLLRSHCYLSHAVKNKHMCQHCQKAFSKSTALTNHISLIHEFKCIVCNEKFESKQDLETHKKIIHKGDKSVPPYKCRMCPSILDTLDTCKAHIHEHSDVQYPCPICQKRLSANKPAIEHLRTHFTEEVPSEYTPMEITIDEATRQDSSIDVLGGILCCVCDNIFHTRAEIDIHFEELHSDKTISYSCNVCGESFEKYHVFGAHCYNHYSKGRFACDQCYKTFSRLSLLVMHMEMFHMVCSEEKPFQCKECGRGFYTILRLHEHRRLVHGEEECMYRCNRPNCTDTFGKPRELLQHLLVHGSALDRWCRVCGLQLATLGGAERHLGVHARAAYPCPVCTREYHERYLLVKHAASHFERVFHVCAVCGKAYRARHRLIEHMKVHASHSVKNACAECGKSFQSKQSLAQHENTHTGLKPFTCTKCPKTFASYPNWRKHLTRVHSLASTVVRDIYQQTYKNTSPHNTQTSPCKAESGIESSGSELSDVYQQSYKNNSQRQEQTSPCKAESGIESAGSELSDVYAFASDESSDINDWKTHKMHHTTEKLREKPETNINDQKSIEETVRSCIDALDNNLNEKTDMKLTVPETQLDFNMSNNLEEESDILAIVEHMDTLTGETDTMEPREHPAKYTHMMLLDDHMFTADAVQSVESGGLSSGVQAEYGPDSLAEIMSLGEHLPHINPLLTITPDTVSPNCKLDLTELKPVQGIQLHWPPPTITKLSHYVEKDDANRFFSIYY